MTARIGGLYRVEARRWTRRRPLADSGMRRLQPLCLPAQRLGRWHRSATWIRFQAGAIMAATFSLFSGSKRTPERSPWAQGAVGGTLLVGPALPSQLPGPPPDASRR